MTGSNCAVIECATWYSKRAWRARLAGGQSAREESGSGYVRSRYSIMGVESERNAGGVKVLSISAGRVYFGVPSVSTLVGGIPSDLQTDSMSVVSTHFVP